MDTKALAKSKRAHSLHHSKKHNPHQASKAPSASSGDKKPTGNLPKQKPRQSHSSARPLPSNWDRYYDDSDLGSGGAPNASPSLPAEFVAPKSKGADYDHLISEAKAQAQANYPSDAFPFSDDNIYSFTRDFGPMLAEKGKNIFSWISDDGFEFESKPGSNIEAPFLSLNLNAVAEQLAKAKLSQRLFIEADLLPLELLDGEDKHVSHPVPSVPIASGKDDREPLSSHVSMSNFPVQTAEEGPNSMNLITDEKLESEGTLNSSAGNPSTFEAASAEAELDMLLNSFTETKIFEPPPSESSAGILSFPAAPATKPTSIDDAIDNLLEETSGMTKTDQDSVSSSTTHPGSKSKLINDFDSWLDTI